MNTVREFVDRLVEKANALPAGLESEIELAICDGSTMTLVERVDVGKWANVDQADGTQTRTFIVVRGHLHPDDEPATMRAATADVDDELRRLVDDN